jgi:hypothetical protein
MTKAPKTPNTDKPALTLASSNETPVTPIKPKVAKLADVNPPVTFSPEKLAELLNMLSDQKAELAALKANMVETNKVKIDQAVKVVAGKSEKSTANEKAAVKAFKKLGITAQPRVDTFTFNLWLAKGFRPIEGSKSVRVANLRLFHESQVRPLTAAETKAAKTQLAAAKLRREGSPNLELHDLDPDAWAGGGGSRRHGLSLERVHWGLA